MLIVIVGLPGTGKTFLAQHLAQALHFQHLSSDQIRESLTLKGNYSPENKNAVYDTMIKQAKQIITQGQSVVLDATFSKEENRKKVVNLGKQTDTNVFFIELTADEKSIKERVSKKREHSEANFDVYKKIRSTYEPLQSPHLRLDSSKMSVEEMVGQIKSVVND